MRAFLDGFRESLHLTRLRKAFPQASYLNSTGLSRKARLGTGVGIASGAVVGPGVCIGDYSYINRGTLVTSGTIGKYCSVAHYVHIGPEMHPTRLLSTSPNLYGAHRSIVGADIEVSELGAPPRIGNDVLIGAGAIVQQRVSIGDGAIIAAGSVVTRDVPPFAIAAGVKAEVIGYRFDPKTISRVLADPWWDWPQSRVGELRLLIEAGEDWVNIYP